MTQTAPDPGAFPPDVEHGALQQTPSKAISEVDGYILAKRVGTKYHLVSTLILASIKEMFSIPYERDPKYRIPVLRI